ncbi:MAG: aryl-sulfate sulfotransferase [Acidimicrobiales bacterium]|nr:aryl-sulfate sulfotransferase [Acidimicrobiales bacterium]
MRRFLSVAAVALILAGACSSDDDASPTTEASGDVGLAAEVELDDGHALVGRLTVDADEAVAPEIEVIGSERSFEIPVEEAATSHELPVAGLRAEQDYRVVVRAGDEEVDLDLQTGKLPFELPLSVETADAERMSDGFTMFNLLRGGDLLDPGDPELAEGEEPPPAGLLVAVDADGEVVWYHQTPHPIGDVRPLSDGRILHEYNDTGARIIDLLGETQQEWAGEIVLGPLEIDEHGRRVAGDDAVEVAVDSMHHEVARLPDGNMLTISTEVRTYDGFDEPLCDEAAGEFDGSYELIVDVIVEYTPDGEIVAEYPLADYFDPVNEARDQNVCGLPFADVFPNWLYAFQGNDDARDWTHANGVVPSPDGEALTVSVRHLSAVLQIDRETGELLWRFGPDGDFEIDDPADFSYYQHAPEWQDDGTLLLYDNGNNRPPADEPDYSRAARYRLDPEAGTVEQVWSYTSQVDGEPAFAPFVGDADMLENGNVLITNGGYQGRDDGITAQLVEVVPDGAEGGDVVFEARLDDPEVGYIVYRAERVPTFYP